MFKQMLRDLLLTYGPSGREDAIAACIERYAAPHADQIRRDALGNLIVRRAGTSGRRVMLSAHMDQIGLVVVDIDETGFLRVAPVGGIQAAVAAARQVVKDSFEVKTYQPNPAMHALYNGEIDRFRALAK